MMIGYDIYDCFTMEHFRLRQRMTLTTKIYCSQLYIQGISQVIMNPAELKMQCTIHFANDVYVKNYETAQLTMFYIF
jgi:hypothetical protein